MKKEYIAVSIEIIEPDDIIKTSSGVETERIDFSSSKKSSFEW